MDTTNLRDKVMVYDKSLEKVIFVDLKTYKEKYSKKTKKIDKNIPVLPSTKIKNEKPEICCYFIKCHSNPPTIKIGFTRNVQQRIKQTQTYCPFNLELLTLTKKYKEIELHRMFEEYRIKGEWFRYEGALKVFIEDLLR